MMKTYKYDFTKAEIATYISDKFYNMYNEAISPFMLNKCMYFLFGYDILEKTLRSDDPKSDITTLLFPTNFKIGVYGPLDDELNDIDKSYRHWSDFKHLDAHIERVFKKPLYDLLCAVRGHSCCDTKHISNKETSLICEEDIIHEFQKIIQEKEIPC